MTGRMGMPNGSCEPSRKRRSNRAPGLLGCLIPILFLSSQLCVGKLSQSLLDPLPVQSAAGPGVGDDCGAVWD